MAWNKAALASSTRRGYDNKHRALRAKLLPSAYGTPCCRCGHTMLLGQVLHFDHNDARTGYLGFSHGSRCQVCGKRCNLVAAAKKARRNQIIRKKKKLMIMDTSRQW